MALVQIIGVLASSAPMNAYGGVTISEDAIKGMANTIELGPTTLGVRHDPRHQIPARIVESFTRRGHDGYLEIVVCYEIDDADWTRYDGASMQGFSISSREPFLSKGNEAVAITVSADAHWFSDHQLRQSFEQLSAVFDDVEVCRLYQFSIDPSSLVVIQLALGDLSSLGIGLLTNYLYDALRNLVRPEKNGSREPSKFSIELTDTVNGRTVKAYVETSSERTLRHALDSLPAALRSELTQLEFSSEDHQWHAEQ